MYYKTKKDVIIVKRNCNIGNFQILDVSFGQVKPLQQMLQCDVFQTFEKRFIGQIEH